MTTLEITLIALSVWIVLFSCSLFAFYVLKTKILMDKEIIKSHRELWQYYFANYDELKDIFSKSNSKIKTELSDKKYMFLVMLFNHMELVFKTKKYDMLPRDLSIKEDMADILSNSIIKDFWAVNKQFRSKSFVKFIDKLI